MQVGHSQKIHPRHKANAGPSGGALEKAGRTPLLGKWKYIPPFPELDIWEETLQKLSTRRPRLAWAGQEIRGGVVEDGVGCSLWQ